MHTLIDIHTTHMNQLQSGYDSILALPVVSALCPVVRALNLAKMTENKKLFKVPISKDSFIP